MIKRILVAGIGNIFFGDDAFGCEVAAELTRRNLPAGVKVKDFGIRGYDLAYAMMEDVDATILIDAAPRGEPAGTVYLLELDPGKIEVEGNNQISNAHDLTPVRVLQLVRALGGQVTNLFLVGCEPTKTANPEGEMGLSEPVKQAVGPAASMVEELISKLSRDA